MSFTGARSMVGTGPVPLVSAGRPVRHGTRVKAAASNRGLVYVGLSPLVTAGTSDATDGHPLAPGEAVWVPREAAEDVSAIHVVASEGGQKVFWSADLPETGAAVPGGWLTSEPFLSAGGVNATAVKKSAGRLGGWTGYNHANKPRYVKFYDQAVLPDPARDAPFLVVTLPGGGPPDRFEVSWGIAFSRGLAFCVVAGPGPADVTPAGAGDVVLTVLYQ